MNIYHTHEETVRHLQNLKEVIADTDLVLVDDDFIGDKKTEASWGLCTFNPRVYDQPSDFLFGNSRKYHLVCPMDSNQDLRSASGCFYRCKLFKGEVTGKEEATRLVNISIEKYSK